MDAHAGNDVPGQPNIAKLAKHVAAHGQTIDGLRFVAALGLALGVRQRPRTSTANICTDEEEEIKKKIQRIKHAGKRTGCVGLV